MEQRIGFLVQLPCLLACALVDVESDTKKTGFWATLLLLFDLRVERYMTPYIVRVYWAMAMVVIVLYAVEFALSHPAEQSSPQGSDEAISAESFGQNSPSTLHNAASSREYFEAFISAATEWMKIVALVLGIRVACEMLVVAFNMANSLKSIDRQIASLGRLID